ncbi:hypothetical protein CYMTET_39681 [Cymbomonas tetramitiformis]|uniref:Uncharacterized protein n=1 Tax=Cymbomonas tetramitiformis TaxID=36881 RepID=A0AAE0C9N4_9CHLO|nr:hypothetical protein CYMTET_39681 [Cymbomonas tetramitiformis]
MRRISPNVNKRATHREVRLDSKDDFLPTYFRSLAPEVVPVEDAQHIRFHNSISNPDESKKGPLSSLPSVSTSPGPGLSRPTRSSFVSVPAAKYENLHFRYENAPDVLGAVLKDRSGTGGASSLVAKNSFPKFRSDSQHMHTGDHKLTDLPAKTTSIGGILDNSRVCLDPHPLRESQSEHSQQSLASPPSDTRVAVFDLFQSHFQHELRLADAPGTAGPASLSTGSPAGEIDVLRSLSTPKSRSRMGIHMEDSGEPGSSEDCLHSHFSLDAPWWRGLQEQQRHSGIALFHAMRKLLAPSEEGGLGLAGSAHGAPSQQEEEDADEQGQEGTATGVEHSEEELPVPRASTSRQAKAVADPIVQTEYAKTLYCMCLEELARQNEDLCPEQTDVLRIVSASLAGFFNELVCQAMDDRKKVQHANDKVRLEKENHKKTIRTILLFAREHKLTLTEHDFKYKDTIEDVPKTMLEDVFTGKGRASLSLATPVGRETFQALVAPEIHPAVETTESTAAETGIATAGGNAAPDMQRLSGKGDSAPNAEELVNELSKAKAEADHLREHNKRLTHDIASLQDMLRRARVLQQQLLPPSSKTGHVADGETRQALGQAVNCLQIITKLHTVEQRKQCRRQMEYVAFVLRAAEVASSSGDKGGGLAFKRKFIECIAPITETRLPYRHQGQKSPPLPLTHPKHSSSSFTSSLPSRPNTSLM